MHDSNAVGHFSTTRAHVRLMAQTDRKFRSNNSETYVRHPICTMQGTWNRPTKNRCNCPARTMRRCSELHTRRHWMVISRAIAT